MDEVRVTRAEDLDAGLPRCASESYRPRFHEKVRQGKVVSFTYERDGVPVGMVAMRKPRRPESKHYEFLAFEVPGVPPEEQGPIYTKLLETIIAALPADATYSGEIPADDEKFHGLLRWARSTPGWESNTVEAGGVDPKTGEVQSYSLSQTVRNTEAYKRQEKQ